MKIAEQTAVHRNAAPRCSLHAFGCSVAGFRNHSWGRLVSWLGVIVLATLSIVLCACLVGCANRVDVDTGCDVMSMQESRSPDWLYISTVWSVFCYDTTGFTPMAHLRPAGEHRPDVGNLLVACPGDRILTTWTGTNALLVEYWTRELYRHPPATTNVYGVAVSFKRRFDE